MRLGQTRQDIGQIDDTIYIGLINAGRAIVETLVQEGLFVRERTEVFETILHVSDTDTWLRYREERSSKSLVAPEIIERARAALPRDDGELLIIEHGYACRLRKRHQVSRQ